MIFACAKLGKDMSNDRSRPGHVAEAQARGLVRVKCPRAASAYVVDGAIVYDEATGTILGHACAGDWAVEAAWQDAASKGPCVE